MNVSIFFIISIACMGTFMKPCMVIGHRGAGASDIENTVSSFKKAIEMGVDMVELDVWQCASGEIVVFHDEMVDRLANGSGPLKNRTLSEIKELDLANGERIPTLEEVLHVIDRRVRVNIEIKDPHASEPVCALIQQYVNEKQWSYKDFLVTSFNHFLINEICVRHPLISTGVISSAVLLNYGDYLSKLDVEYAVVYARHLTPQFNEDIKRSGKKIIVYTVNYPETVQRMLQLGVDGMVTDCPDLLSKELAARI